MMSQAETVTISKTKLQALEAVAAAAMTYVDHAEDSTWLDLLKALEMWEKERQSVDQRGVTT